MLQGKLILNFILSSFIDKYFPILVTRQMHNICTQRHLPLGNIGLNIINPSSTTIPHTKVLPSTFYSLQAGIYVMTLFDNYCAGFSLMVVALLELVAIAWVYGKLIFHSSYEVDDKLRGYANFF